VELDLDTFTPQPVSSDHTICGLELELEKSSLSERKNLGADILSFGC
jgi:hypothetical protein